MRIRKTDASGEPRFGNGASDYHHDTPAAVAELVACRLKLMTGEWFLDVGAGTPYYEKVLGYGTAGLYDTALRQRMLDTEGVRQLAGYESRKDWRHLSVAARIDTVFGPSSIGVTL